MSLRVAFVFPVLARAIFSFLGLTGTSGSHAALFAKGFLLTRLSILGLIFPALLRLGPAFLRLRSGAFERMNLAVLRLAFFGFL